MHGYLHGGDAQFVHRAEFRSLLDEVRGVSVAGGVFGDGYPEYVPFPFEFS